MRSWLFSASKYIRQTHNMFTVINQRCCPWPCSLVVLKDKIVVLGSDLRFEAQILGLDWGSSPWSWLDVTLTDLRPMSDTQQSQATLSRNFTAQQSCLSDIAQLLSSRATKLLDRNHLCSSAISRSVAELLFVNCLFTCQLLIFVAVWMVDKIVEAINKALLIIMSSSVSLETMLVWRLFADGKLTVA